VIGICFKKKLEPMFESAWVAGCGLLVTATLLILSQWVRPGQFSERKLPWGIAFLVGCFQAVALVPGISRSGSTISGGLLSGMQRESAGTFSFLIAIPAVGGAAFLDGLKLLKPGAAQAESIPTGALVLGMVISFVVGIVALRLLLQLISKQRLHYFGYYCLLAGSVTLLWKVLGH
jgi:undecaprenyl-diphosphatase